jgi:Arylsulfotransferase (ASST)
MRARKLLGALALLAACGSDLRVVTPPIPPVIDAVAVAPSPDNVLGAVVGVRVRRADSVAVRYAPPPGLLLDSITPAVVPLGDSAVVPVLGLLPGTAYMLRVVAYGSGQTVLSDLQGFTTDTLPLGLPSYLASGTESPPGYVAFAAGAYGLVIDNTGRVVWYHRFAPLGPGLNFQPQPNGRYVAHPPTADPSDLEPWVEVDPLGRVTRTFGCARGLQSRFHDLIAQLDGAYWVMCDETRTMDLSGLGGVASAKVTGTVIQHLSAGGTLLFEWNPFDHFDITDLDSASRTGANVNWTHGNALDLDTDGNLLVSFRSLSEITKIDTRSGAVIWRMGGLRNEFTFQGGPTSGFARQHGLRGTGAGHLMLLDNLGDLSGSQAERYVYDATAHTAQLLGSYTPSPPVVALLGGTTQDLPGGHTLVAFGNGERVEEYDAAGRMVWHIEGKAGYVFRAERIRSLYSPGVGSAR